MNNLTRIGIVIGRFQPLHLGHMNIIKTMIEENDKVIILIGRDQHDDDLFDYDERKEMVEQIFNKEINDSILKIFPISDIGLNDNKYWYFYVLGIIINHICFNDIITFYIGDDIDYFNLDILKLNKIKIGLRIIHRKETKLAGTHIRKLIKNKKWEKLTNLVDDIIFNYIIMKYDK